MLLGCWITVKCICLFLINRLSLNEIHRRFETGSATTDQSEKQLLLLPFSPPIRSKTAKFYFIASLHRI